jgi:hypothetical protein
MHKLDFVSGDDFRRSLEADAVDLDRCLEHNVWKGAVVLAGSIVEALLTDSLLSIKRDASGTKDPLKMSFDELIDACVKEALITSSTGSLCSAVKEYRNLIHPGRAMRLKAIADQNVARVADGLVGMIATEVAGKRKETLGYTAEQLVSKVEGHESALAIMAHLIVDLSDRERERLLLDVGSMRYREIRQMPPIEGIMESRARSARLGRLRSCYRAVLESSKDELRRRVARGFVQILKQGTADDVSMYLGALFVCADMAWLDQAECDIVKAHVLNRMEHAMETLSIGGIKGIEGHLVRDEVGKWMDAVVRQIVRNRPVDQLVTEWKEYVAEAVASMKKDAADMVRKRLEMWSEHFEKQKVPDMAALMRELATTGTEGPFDLGDV